MDMSEARGIAAQCWCEPDTRDLEMDADLAEAFARRLVEHVNADTPVALARRVIANAFEESPDFRDTYVANVAMLLHDRYGITDYDERNRAGDDIIRLIFES